MSRNDRRAEKQLRAKAGFDWTTPKSPQLLAGQSDNDAKKPTAKNRDNKHEEIGRCERTDLLLALEAIEL
jgi:hypothetical protein